MNPPNELKPWGAYAPTGTRKLLRAIVRLGLSRGPIKKLVEKLWPVGTENQPVDIEYAGVKFRLMPWNNVDDRKILFGSKSRDKEEIRFLASHLAPDSIFLDIGANIGHYACLLAKSGLKHIVAIEPHPITQSRLKFNIEANNFQDRITIAPFAIGSSSGEAILTTCNDDLGSSTVLSMSDTGIQARYKVQMISLLELCKNYGIDRIEAAKIDIEGFEDKALIPLFDSAPRSLWPRYIVIEHAHHTKWKSDLFGKLNQCGYKTGLKTRANTIFEL